MHHLYFANSVESFNSLLIYQSMSKNYCWGLQLLHTELLSFFHTDLSERVFWDWYASSAEDWLPDCVIASPPKSPNFFIGIGGGPLMDLSQMTSQ